MEVLIHVGVETVSIKGEDFECLGKEILLMLVRRLFIIKRRMEKLSIT